MAGNAFVVKRMGGMKKLLMGNAICLALEINLKYVALHGETQFTVLDTWVSRKFKVYNAFALLGSNAAFTDFVQSRQTHFPRQIPCLPSGSNKETISF